MIKLKNVTFGYKDIPALKNISVNINKGDSIALIGPNGSGKSTLLKLIAAIVYPDYGEYYFEDIRIDEKKMQENRFAKLFHKRIGFVFQNSDSQLFCSNVYDEVAFAPLQMGLCDDEVKLRVNDSMNLLKIGKLGDRSPYNLSGGEKKRVAIASVLSHNPDVLILDEPMNGLDPKTKNFLRELLIKLNSCGKTIICSTHDFEYVEGIFKKALVFSDKHEIIRNDDYDKVIKDRKFLIENNIL